MIKIVKTIIVFIFWIFTVSLTERYIVNKLPNSAIVGILTLIVVIFIYIPIIFIIVNYMFKYIKNKNYRPPIIFALLSFINFALLFKVSAFIANKIPSTTITNVLIVFGIIYIYIPLSIIFADQIIKIIQKYDN